MGAFLGPVHEVSWLLGIQQVELIIVDSKILEILTDRY